MKMRMKRTAGFALMLLAGVAIPVAESAAHSRPEIRVLSNRADLISGGDALVEIDWHDKDRKKKSKATVELNGVNITSVFAKRADGRYMGLVTGLRNGKNVLTARSDDDGAQITIRNHPIGGPVFSGAQLQPWICATVAPTVVTVAGNAGQTATATTRASGLSTEPVDAQCNTATDYSYYFQPKASEGTDCTFSLTGSNPCFVPFPTVSDPATRPADAEIADFTNDRGDTAKSIVRVERGVLNRNLYQLVSFFDPAVASAPWQPQKGWNQKLFWRFGAGASTSRFMESIGVGTIFLDRALRLGFMVGSAHLTNNGSNSNNTLAAETLMMVKEKIVENYGEIRYTMSDGGSGGSIMQHSIASAYPGLTDGAMVTISYSDMITTWIEVVDCGLLQATATQASPGGYYFRDGSPGNLLTIEQKTAINGHDRTSSDTTPGFCNSWTGSFLRASDPTASNCGFGFPAELIYDPVANPQGVRCSTYDHDASLVGTFLDADGVRKANVPRDNVGLQYGLKALQDGVITPEQFVQLNEQVGGYDTDRVWSLSRMEADRNVLRTYYRGGLVSDGRQLARIPIIDMRRQNGLNGDIHMNWRSLATRDRLDRDHGDHESHVIWSGSQTGLADEAFGLMDTWLASVESDRSHRSLERKVANNKPAGAVDFCQLDDGARVSLTDPACEVQYFGSPRQVAGGPKAENVFKCKLKSLLFGGSDYAGVTFTPDQEQRLRAVFPDGVCDWNRRGVGQEPVEPWTTFAKGPGGRPLGDPPASGKIEKHGHDEHHRHGHGKHDRHGRR